MAIPSNPVLINALTETATAIADPDLLLLDQGGVHKKISGANLKASLGTIWNQNPDNTLFYNLNNVGIGSSTPQAKLHVVGQTRLEGNVAINVAGPAARGLHVGGSTTSGWLRLGGTLELGTEIQFPSIQILPPAGNSDFNISFQRTGDANPRARTYYGRLTNEPWAVDAGDGTASLNKALIIDPTGKVGIGDFGDVLLDDKLNVRDGAVASWQNTNDAASSWSYLRAYAYGGKNGLFRIVGRNVAPGVAHTEFWNHNNLPLILFHASSNNLLLPNVPTSASGLSAGMVWRSGTQLMIV